MAMVGDMSVRLALDTSAFNKGVDESKGKLSGMGGEAQKSGGGVKSLVGTMLGIAGGIGIVAVASKGFELLTGFISDSVNAAKTAQVNQAILAQTIKATGGVAGVSAEHANSLAESLSKVTMFSADSTVGAENLLLTFRNVGNKGGVFDQATQATLNMSQALGQDLKSSSIQLGKALNDPIKGITALSRVGVTFDQDQKNLIKTYMAHGEIAKAQGVILNELNHEFGGVAQAAGGTLAGKMSILNNQWELTKEKVGGAIIPLMQKVLTVLAPVGFFIADQLVGALAQFQNATTQLSPIFDAVGAAVAPVFDDLKGLATDMGFMSKNILPSLTGGLGSSGLGGALSGTKPIIAGVKSAFSGLGDVINNVDIFLVDVANSLHTGHAAFTPLETAVVSAARAFSGFANTAKSTIMPVAMMIGDIIVHTVLPGFMSLMPHLMTLGTILIGSVVPAALAIGGALLKVGGAIATSVLPVIKMILPYLFQFGAFLIDNIGAGLKYIAPYVTQAANEVGKFAGELGQKLGPAMKVIGGIIVMDLNIIKTIWTAVWPYLSGVLKGVWSVIVGIIQVAWSIVSGIFKIALDLISGNWKGVWKDITDMVSGVFAGFKRIFSGEMQILGSLISGGLHAIGGFFSFIGTAISNTWNGFWNGITNGAKSAVGGLWAIITAPINAVLAFFKNIKWQWPHINLPHFSIQGSFSLTPPSTPHLQVDWYKNGGIFSGPQVIGVGEAGPEAVAPISKLKEMIGGGHGGMGDVTLMIDRQVLAKIMGPELVNLIRRGAGIRNA